MCATDLLELLDGTLVDSTALVDQVCEVCKRICPARECSVPVGDGRLRPVVVDFPESTWPMTTTLICAFSLLWAVSCGVLAMLLMARRAPPRTPCWRLWFVYLCESGRCPFGLILQCGCQ